jgi:hypothetical protein
MKTCKTSRVVIIDDIREEAMPVMEALGRLGIGAIYIPGDKLEHLPKGCPLRGIRLVFLDMRLDDTGGEKQTASKTANVFRTVISADEGPLIVCLWTKHPDDVPAFKAALFELEPKFLSTLLIADFAKSSATVSKVIKQVESLHREWSPMNFLWLWEQLAHNAATGTTAMLANHVSQNAAIEATESEEKRREKWLSALRRLLLTLARAAAGDSATEKTAKEDLLEALIAIDSDRLEVEAAAAKHDDLSSVFDVPGAGVTAVQRAELNGLLLLGAASEKPQELRPGNVYHVNAASVKRGLFKRCDIDFDSLTDEILGQFLGDPEFKQLQKAVDQAKEEVKQKAEMKRDERRKSLVGQCQSILVEITPSCDFAQRTRHLARFAGGMLVPIELEKVIHGKKESLRRLEPVKLPGIEGQWIPVFSGRFVFSLKDPRKCVRTLPAFRIRAQVLADLRNWYASQASRPGYLSIPNL